MKIVTKYVVGFEVKKILNINFIEYTTTFSYKTVKT